MEKERPLAIHVYRDMLKQAEILRQKAVRLNKEGRKEEEDVCDAVSCELYYWVGQLELTPEINPPISK